jgi:hypothetical protein
MWIQLGFARCTVDRAQVQGLTSSRAAAAAARLAFSNDGFGSARTTVQVRVLLARVAGTRSCCLHEKAMVTG